MTEKRNKPGQHFCSISSAEPGYSRAIDDCSENDKGEFWVQNDEYGSQVNFCPVCGARAPVQVEAKWFWSAQ